MSIFTRHSKISIGDILKNYNIYPEKICSRILSEEVIVMHFEKMKTKYMKQYVLKSFFRKLAGCHLVTLLRIKYITDSFQRF